MLAHPSLARAAPLLVLANKRDLPTALAPAEVAAALRLDGVRGRPWHVAPASALSGDGVDAGLDWLAARLLAAR